MKWRRTTAGAMVALGLLFMVAAPVSAHVLKSDNGITAELHIPPLDQPVASQPTTLEFTFTRLPATFSLLECDCRVQVAAKTGTPVTISTQSDSSHANRLTSQETFPRGGNYTVVLSGYTTSGHKTRFNIAYSVPVNPAPDSSGNSRRTLGAVLVGACALAALVVLLLYHRSERAGRHAG